MVTRDVMGEKRKRERCWGGRERREERGEERGERDDEAIPVVDPADNSSMPQVVRHSPLLMDSNC